MKTVLIVTVFAFVLTGQANAQGTPAKPKPGIGGPREDLAHDAEIRKLYDEFQAAWNKHDVKAMAAMFSIDADYLEPDGTVAKGRDQIEKLLTSEHTSVFKNSPLKLDIDTVWFITRDVALIDGSYEVSNVTDPQGKSIGSRKGHLSAILLQEHEKWYIAASRLMIPAPLPWKKP